MPTSSSNSTNPSPGDVEVDRPDVLELEAKNGLEERRVEDPVEDLLESEPVAVEHERPVHVADGDSTVEEAGDGRHGRTQPTERRSVVRRSTAWRST